MNAKGPVSRRRVLLGTVGLVAAIIGIVALTEALRYPHPTTAAATAPEDGPEPASDPRDIVECGAPLPREGQAREQGAPAEAPGLVTSSQMYDCPQQFDGGTVHYRGEVVGAVLQRRDGAWVQVNDDIYSQSSGPLPAHRDYRGGNGGIGVFISLDAARSISAVGGPGMRGDVLDVVGTFHRVDPESKEVAVIRAHAVTRTPGEPFELPPLPGRRLVAIGMALCAGAVVALERRAARAAR